MPGVDLATFQASAGIGLETRVCRADFSSDADRLGHRNGLIRRGDRDAAWADCRGRMARYAFLAALADNTAYADSLHRWSRRIKEEFALSPEAKPVFNPFGRLREFWANHLYSGTLDPRGGDGKSRPTSVPIETANEALRDPVVRVLQSSDWDINQTTFGRLGSGLGDVGLFSVNDIDDRSVHVEVIHPENIVLYETDCRNRGTYYLLREWRYDPRPDTLLDPWGRPQRVLYLEEGWTRDGRCHFRTYLAGPGGAIPFAWDENQGVEWSEDYPFLPLELVAHIRPLPRCPFGEAEAQGIVPKILESDDIASLVNEAIRKYVDPVWLFAGLRADTDLDISKGRETLPALFSTDPNARAQSLLAAIPFDHFAAILDRHKAEIEDDKPELQKAIKNATGDASGTALRFYQQSLETKGQTRRAGYDAALKRAVDRCLMMAGMMGYDGFDAFDPDALRADPTALQWRIGERALFKKDALDALIIEEKQAAIAESWDRAGFPIEGYAKAAGWSADRIAALTQSRQAALDKGLPVGRAKQAPPPNESAATAIQSPGGAAP